MYQRGPQPAVVLQSGESGRHTSAALAAALRASEASTATVPPPNDRPGPLSLGGTVARRAGDAGASPMVRPGVVKAPELFSSLPKQFPIA